MLFGINRLVGSDENELEVGERVDVEDEVLFNECEFLSMRGIL